MRSSQISSAPEPSETPAFLNEFKIHRRVLQAGWDDRSARAAGLCQFEIGAGFHSPPIDADHFAQRDAHGHFDQAGEIDVPKDGINLGARAGWGADRAVPFGAVRMIAGTFARVSTLLIRVGLPHKAVGGGVGRAGTRFAAFAFDRFEQGRFFAAHIGARAASARAFRS